MCPLDILPALASNIISRETTFMLGNIIFEQSRWQKHFMKDVGDYIEWVFLGFYSKFT